MAVFSIMLGLFMKVVDSFTTKLPTYFVGAIIAVPSMSLVNSGMFTVMLTHGFLFSVFIIWVLSGWMQRKEPPRPDGER
jgi:O-antigen polymerase